MKLRIICIGNLLHGNDGVGQQVFERLECLSLPNCVDLVDGGIGGLALLPFCKGAEHLVFVDMMKSAGEAGQLNIFEDVLNELPENSDCNSEHGGNLLTLLHMLPIYLQSTPQVDLLCITAPDSLHYSPGLLQTVQDAVEQLVSRIQESSRYLR